MKRQNLSTASPYFSKSREKTFSRNKSITKMQNSPGNKTVAVVLSAIQPSEPYSALKQKTGFQKFSRVDRFFPDPRLNTPNLGSSKDSTDMKREINYRPVLQRPDTRALHLEYKDYVLSHLTEVKNLNPRGLFMKRKFSSLKHGLKLKQAQEQHQRIQELKLSKLAENWEHKVIKTNSIVPPAQGVKVIQNWSGVVSISGLLSHVGKLYIRRKAVRARINQWISLLYNISRLLGKFKRRVFHAHRRKAMFKLLIFVKIHCKRWLKRRRVRHVNRILTFCKQQQRAPYLVHLMNQFLERVRFLQKWLRRITVRFSIRTAIMNLQWSNIESDISGNQKAKSPRLLKTTSGAISQPDSERSLDECPISYNAYKSSHDSLHRSPSKPMSTIIPLKMRLLYIRPVLWQEQRKYSIAKRLWIEQTKKLQEQHTLRISKLNSQRLMMGQAPVREKFVPSKEPTLKMFIDKDWMNEMVKDAIANKIQWQLNKNFKPDLEKVRTIKLSFIKKHWQRNQPLGAPQYEPQLSQEVQRENRPSRIMVWTTDLMFNKMNIRKLLPSLRRFATQDQRVSELFTQMRQTAQGIHDYNFREYFVRKLNEDSEKYIDKELEGQNLEKEVEKLENELRILQRIQVVQNLYYKQPTQIESLRQTYSKSE